MKILCVDCGCHFEDEFKDSLKCTFWARRGLSKLPEKYKKIIWDWIFSLPYDEIGTKTHTAIVMSWYGIPHDGNDFEKNVEGYKDWSDKERRMYQKLFFLSMLGRETKLLPDKKEFIKE